MRKKFNEQFIFFPKYTVLATKNKITKNLHLNLAHFYEILGAIYNSSCFVNLPIYYCCLNNSFFFLVNFNVLTQKDKQRREIIVYSRSTINAYSFLSHEWWVLLIKFMVGPTIHVRGGSTHLWYSGVPNNFPTNKGIFLTNNSQTG